MHPSNTCPAVLPLCGSALGLWISFWPGHMSHCSLLACFVPGWFSFSLSSGTELLCSAQGFGPYYGPSTTMFLWSASNIHLPVRTSICSKLICLYVCAYVK